MLSSIICLVVQHICYSGTLDNVMPWNMWFGFMAVSLVETITWLVFLFKFDERSPKNGR